MKEFVRFWRHFVEMLGVTRGVTLMLAVALAVCAFVLAHTEGIADGEALYFTMITGLTVGYGDITPTSPIGRVVSVLAALNGVIFVGLVVAIATRALAITVQEERDTSERKE